VHLSSNAIYFRNIMCYDFFKFLLLRKALLDTAGKGKALEKGIGEAIPGFMAIFRALLFLKGKKTPSKKGELSG
jgi:hypothetical protein